jgi:hypothetical protein
MPRVQRAAKESLIESATLQERHASILSVIVGSANTDRDLIHINLSPYRFKGRSPKVEMQSLINKILVRHLTQRDE